MNYYPSYNTPYYMNYPSYNNPNNPYSQMVQNQQQAMPPVTQVLNGKIVDSQDVVKATEVPIGSYGIFPKADLSEIYIKSWNNNGTTNIITFKPEFPQEEMIIQSPQEESLNIILQQLRALENKIDNIITQPQAAIPEPPQVEIKREKEFKANEY